MRFLRKALAGGAVTAVAAALLGAGVGTASAAAPVPPYEPDGNSIGTLSFYDASGNQIYGGNITADPFAAYVVGSTTWSTAPLVGNLFGYLPKAGQAPGAFSGEQLSGPTTYPVTSAPAPINGFGNRPVVKPLPGDLNLANLRQDFPQTAPAGDPYDGLYQIRIKVNTFPAGKYMQASIKMSNVVLNASGLPTSGTWEVVYPTPPTATTATLSANKTSPQVQGTAVTLTTAVAPAAAAGSVQFLDNGAALGSPVAVSGGSASTTVTPATGSHNYTSVFTPTDTATYAGATSNAVPFQINAPAAPTSLTLSVNPTTGDAATAFVFSSTLTGGSPAAALAGKTVTFTDSADGTLGTATTNASGVATVTKKLTAGGHSVVASFAGEAGVYNAASSQPVTLSVAADPNSICSAPGSQCTDPQTIKVTVNAGTLSISTPYTPTNPFDLGTMALDADGARLTASKPFGTAGTAAAAGVTITDTRAGDLPWTASASSTDLTAGANSINAQNLSLTGVTPVYVSGNALNATTKQVATSDINSQASYVRPAPPAPVPANINGYAPGAAGNDGLKGTGHTFATAAKGVGTVYVYGNLNLVAPTSTAAGTYLGTVTFTIG